MKQMSFAKRIIFCEKFQNMGRILVLKYCDKWLSKRQVNNLPLK